MRTHTKRARAQFITQIYIFQQYTFRNATRIINLQIQAAHAAGDQGKEEGSTNRKFSKHTINFL